MRLFLIVILFFSLSFAANVRAQCTAITIDCPADITVTLDGGECREVVHYVVGTSGTCTLQSLTQTDPSGLTSGDEFPIGVTRQSWESIDTEGNIDTCSFLVTIIEYPNPINSEACNNSINLSPDTDCEVFVTADMVLEGGPYGCYENYIVTITTISGDPVPNPITSAYIGETLIATVTDPNGTMCWGYINYEDYLITSLLCRSTDINCRNNLDPSTNPLDSIPFPIPAGFNIIPSSGVGPFIVEDYDNCGDISLSFYDDIVELDCTNGGPFTRIIYRTWTALDGQGNTTSCVDTINVRIPSFSSTNIFPNRDGTEAPAILCSGNWDTNGDGIPQPEEIGDDLNMNCDVWGEYEDYIHPLTCGTIIDRSWQVVNMCTGELVQFIQKLKLVDDEAPEITCPSQLVGSTNTYNCKANYVVPPPMFSDDCSSVTYTVSSSAGNVVNQGTSAYPHYVIRDLDIGTYTLNYTAIDGCGNQTSCTATLVIRDLNPPQITCESVYTVYLGTGQGQVHVNDLIVFSSDDCGISHAQLRRIIKGDCEGENYDDLQWHNIETFCCEEAGQTIIIEIGIWDNYGNYSTCVSQVVVESNTAPSMTCPPDVTVSCSFPIDLNDLSIFGSVVTQAADVENVVIDDRDWVEYCKGQTYHGPMTWGQDGLVTSACEFDLTEEVVVDTECGSSIFENGMYLPAITRTFIVNNAGGEINSCTQRIYIINCNPQATDIIWPDDVVIDACIGGSTDPADTGRPILGTSSCDEINTTYMDRDEIPAGDTCRHIVRHWVVTSDCKMGSDSVLGEFDQNIYIIKLDPIQLVNCADTVYGEVCNVNPADGCELLVDLELPQVIDCDTTVMVEWNVDFDYDPQAGFISDLSGSGFLPVYLPFGNHLVKWSAADMCGGQASCETTIINVDCVPPLAICEDIGVQVIQDTSGITILAEDIANESLDNCGEVTAQFLVCEGDTSSVKYELYGLVDNTLLKIDHETAAIYDEIAISGLVGELTTLVYVEEEGVFYSLLNNVTNPQLVKISLSGMATTIGDIQVSGETVYFVEGMTFNHNTNEIYVSASIDGPVSIDQVSETILAVNRTNGQSTILTTLIPSFGQSDMDKIEIIENELFVYDGDPNSQNYFSKIDLPISTLTTSLTPIHSYPFRALRDLTFIDQTMYTTSLDRSLIKFKTDDGIPQDLGVTHGSNDYNGKEINGLSFVQSNHVNCKLQDELMLSCDELENQIDTFSYTIVVTDQAGLTDTCMGELIIADSNELCTPPRCELIYAITNGGQYYSINTETGEFILISNTGVTTGNNAVAVNDDLGIGYFGTLQTVHWVDLVDGSTGIVGNIPVTGTLSAAAASFKDGYLYVGPEEVSVIQDIHRIKISADGKGFDSALENLTNGSVPFGNFGDFIVLDGDLGNERMIMSIFNNSNANNIYEYTVSNNTFTLLSSVASTNSSQITIDNVGNIWYFSNGTSILGIIDINTGIVTNGVMVPVLIADMGRAWCPPSAISSTNNYPSFADIQFARNVPNPFNFETEIEFSLTHAQDVNIYIYGIDGILVDQVSMDGQAGVNSWLMKKELTGGTYLYQIVSENSSVTGKMVKQ